MPTLEDVYRGVLLQAPDIPLMTARKFAQDAYLDLSARRGWTYLRKQATLQTLAARSIVVGVTAASTAITSAALFVATDAQRQFRIGSGDTFTILTVTDASNAILDRNYTGSSDAAATASILDAYVTMPADFARFEVIVDTVQQRRIPWWTSQNQLDGFDPQRLTGGVGTMLSPISPSSTGLMRYEWWPRPSNAANYPMIYIARPAAPADTDLLTGVLAERPDVLEAGALAAAARYPGTADRPNAYFNLALARELKAEFEELAQQVNLRDDDLAPQDYVPDEFWVRAAGWDYAGSLTTQRQTDYGGFGGYSYY